MDQSIFILSNSTFRSKNISISSMELNSIDGSNNYLNLESSNTIKLYKSTLTVENHSIIIDSYNLNILKSKLETSEIKFNDIQMPYGDGFTAKKIVDKILSMVRNEYISAKWDKKTANDHWYEGFRQSLCCK